MNGSSVAMAFRCSWEQRGIPCAQKPPGSPTCACWIQYFGPSGHTLVVSSLAVPLPMSCSEWQPIASNNPLLQEYITWSLGWEYWAQLFECIWLWAQLCALAAGSGPDNVFGNKADCSISREWWQNKNQFQMNHRKFWVLQVYLFLFIWRIRIIPP